MRHLLPRRETFWAAALAMTAAVPVACADVTTVDGVLRLELRPDTVRTSSGTRVAFAAVILGGRRGVLDTAIAPAVTVVDTGVAVVEPAPGGDPRGFVLTARRPGYTRVVATATLGGRTVADTAVVDVNGGNAR